MIWPLTRGFVCSLPGGSCCYARMSPSERAEPLLSVGQIGEMPQVYQLTRGPIAVLCGCDQAVSPRAYDSIAIPASSGASPSRSCVYAFRCSDEASGFLTR